MSENMEAFKEIVGDNVKPEVGNKNGVHDLCLMVRPRSSSLRMDTAKKDIDFFTSPEEVINGEVGIRPMALLKSGDIYFSQVSGWCVILALETKAHDGIIDVNGGSADVSDKDMLRVLREVACNYFDSDLFIRDLELARKAYDLTVEKTSGERWVCIFGVRVPTVQACVGSFIPAIQHILKMYSK